jgi:membrane-associated protease RseP (regulator of RpoE activity)
MDALAETEIIDALIRRVFRVEDITTGTPQQGFIRRYRGSLIGDSLQAYDLLSASLKEYHLTPLFTTENGQQLILLVPELPIAKKPKNWINLLMFILTLLSVIVSGGLFSADASLPTDAWQLIVYLVKHGWPFAISLIAILGTHELGHYFAGKAHGVQVTLPFFIPLPLTQLGTMGAFISMKSAPKNKRDLMDIAVAGPLAGFVVSLIVLWIGLGQSTLNTIPAALPEGIVYQMEGNSILYLLMKFLHFGKLLPEPVSTNGFPLLLHWLKYFFTGHPSPLGSLDVTISSVAWAGWVGLLITSLNLIPAGQLDGGHIFQLLFGQKNARRALPFIVVLLGILGLAWSGWWLWAAIVFLLGRSYAQTMDQITELDTKRKVLGWLAIFVFVICFIPVPLMIIG